MKRLLVLILFFFAAPAAAQDDSGLYDLIGVPVMEGLSEIADARLVFDKPEGRIIHAELSGDLPRGMAITFYKETLYQLGWALEGEREDAGVTALMFVRDEEQLLFMVDGLSPLRVVIELGPAGEIQG